LDSVDVYLDAPGAVEEISAFYERELGRDGFVVTTTAEYGPAHPGFVSGKFTARPGLGPPTYRLFCRGEEGAFYRLGVFGPGDPRGTIVSWNSGDPFAHHPCAKQAFAPYHPDVVPTLQGPPGVVVHARGSGGGPDEYSTTGSALTEMPSAELLAHFAAQLETMGWKAEERGAIGPAAWSRWRLPTQEWRAFLVVLEHEADVRHLELLMYTPRALRRLRRWPPGAPWRSIVL
jgi:hypothetical protein